ncbi:MAG TPA: single-stranded-DNA-specific exonuclease RecJ [Patescibacteria group bacterium]|nr:single-stranded-DNA-specific exonuclease RecJ [Patescibacteria group bacterium]
MRTWKVRELAPQNYLNSFAELPGILTQLLYNRGLKTQHDIDAFLNPEYGTGIHDPFLFRDMKKAVDRVTRAIDAKELITIYGDYDADGITGSVVGSTVFRSLGLVEGTDYNVYLPDRFTEGYGVNAKALEFLAKNGTKILITVDCGITSINEVAIANQLGVDVIITDHHSIPKVLPEAYAIMNPRLPEETYPCKLLCGAGTMYKFMQGLLKSFENSGRIAFGISRESVEKWLLDVVAIGTVADMVPLYEENRIFVKYGLVVLEKTKRLGLQRMIENAGYAKSKAKPTTTLIGFQIAPRINAAGRLEHSSVSYKLLMSEDPAEVPNLASSVELANRQRQQITEDIVNGAESQIANFSAEEAIIVVLGNDWPTGVVGVAASRIMQKYHKPTIIASHFNGQIIGSGRSIPGFDMIATLREMGDEWFRNYGGHPMACGFTFSAEKNFDDFRRELILRAGKKLTPDDIRPVLEIEAEVPFHEIDWALFEQLEHLEPYGKDNPKPIFMVRDVIISDMFVVGKGEKHLKFSVEREHGPQKKRLPCIGFGLGFLLDQLSVGTAVDLACEIDVNEWNGNRELQLNVKDVQVVARDKELS